MDSMAKKMGDFIWKKTMGANYRTHNQTNSLGSLKSPKKSGYTDFNPTFVSSTGDTKHMGMGQNLVPLVNIKIAGK